MKSVNDVPLFPGAVEFVVHPDQTYSPEPFMLQEVIPGTPDAMLESVTWKIKIPLQ
jgi:hypothetical protein